VIGFSRHLTEQRLFDGYLREREGASLDPPVADHLNACAQCGARYRELVSFMDGLEATARDETDEIFTADRLRAQQAQIARRLELLAHPGRVISFPGRSVVGAVRRTAYVAPRWLAAAAVAGLVVGVGVGSIYDFTSPEASAPPTARVRTAPPVVPLPPPTDSLLPDDDAFLSELELAAGGPRTRELQPFDAMTPRIQETSVRLR
jgi:hypothetical protein